MIPEGKEPIYCTLKKDLHRRLSAFVGSAIRFWQEPLSPVFQQGDKKTVVSGESCVDAGSPGKHRRENRLKFWRVRRRGGLCLGNGLCLGEHLHGWHDGLWRDRRWAIFAHRFDKLSILVNQVQNGLPGY